MNNINHIKSLKYDTISNKFNLLSSCLCSSDKVFGILTQRLPIAETVIHYA